MNLNTQRRVSLNKRPPLVHTNSPILHHKTSNSSLRYRKPKKSVRFRDNDSLENVRLFLKTQMPKACRSDPAYPKQYTYRLRRPNWPTIRTVGAVRIEDIQLDTANDTVNLVGSIQVANLAFEKHVVVRYTLDDWTTVHEVDAAYREPVANSANTWDRFSFKITLAEHCHQTLDLAIQYTVGGRAFWDNNQYRNYRVQVVPNVLIDDLSSSSDDEDDDNTFEDCIDQDELVEQMKPLTLKEKPGSLVFDHQVKPLSPPLSPTTPIDMNPLWAVTTSNDLTNPYFERTKSNTQFHSLVRNHYFYNDPKQASIYTPYHTDPSCPSKAIHS
jgi:hypothetical protein